MQLKQGTGINAVVPNPAHIMAHTKGQWLHSQGCVNVALLAWQVGGPQALACLEQEGGLPQHVQAISCTAQLHQLTLSIHDGTPDAAMTAIWAAVPEDDARPKVLLVDG